MSTSLVRIGVAVLMSMAVLGTVVPTYGQDTQVLIVTPAEGHSGDTVYLSGSGFAPGSSLIFTMACPAKPAGEKSRVVLGKAGPRIGHSGTFKGASFRALKLQGMATTSCSFYAGGQTSPFAATAPYAIVAQNDPLPWCASHICMTVAYRRIGSQDLLLVTGWPGARGTAKVTKGNYRRRLPVAFDWQGITLLTLSHAAALRGKSAHIVISTRMGRVTGTYSGPLTLTPGQFARRSSGD